MAKINHVHLHQPINSGNRKRVSATIVVNKDIFKSTVVTINLSTTSISSTNLSTNGPNLSAITTGNVSTITANNLSILNDSDPTTKLTGQWSPKAENHAAKLEIVDGSSSADFQSFQSNKILSTEFGHWEFPKLFKSSGYPRRCLTQQLGIHPKTTNMYQQYSASNNYQQQITKPSNTPLFSGTALEEKPITTMYTNVKIDGHHIKLILDSGSAGSIITRQLMDQLDCRVNRAASAKIITADRATKTPISEIDDLPIKINSIIVPIKVLVIEATQYQALVAICGHFKATNTMAPLINFEEKKPKPTWEAYQVLWADKEHNKLPPILSWNDNRKGKQTNELTWETNDLTWTDNEQEEASSWKWNKDKGKEKEKEEGTLPTTAIYNSYIHHTPQQSNYRQPRLVSIDCSKKLSSMVLPEITSDNIEKRSNNRNNKAITSNSKTIESNPVKPKECIKASSYRIQQPVESDPEEYENKSNNPVTAQAKFTVNKKPRVLFPTTLSYHQTPQSRIVFNPPPETQSETPRTSGNPHPWNQHSWTKSLGEYRSLFGNLNPAAGQTEGNPSTWEQPPAQNLAESAFPLTEETAILQPIGSSDKGKQPTLAPEEHSNTRTPISLNITSNTLSINQIMAYQDIAKLEKFSGEEDNTYSWIADAEKAITANGWNNDHTVQALLFFLTGTANSWYQSLAEKPTSFTEFKLAFLQYFCDPNTLIRLQNQFSIIKQKDHEAITTYLGQFNQILCQILAIKRDYYTVVQVLNQFIKELQSSILKSIRPRHPTSLQDAVTLAHDFESAEQKVNHTQAVNLAINKTFDIDAKITQLSEKLTQKIEGFLAGTTGTYQPLQWRENNNNSRYPQQQNCQQQQQPWRSDPHNCYYCQKSGHIAHDCRRKIMDQNQGNPYQQRRYQQNMVPQYSIPQNQPPLYAQQVPYTQPPPQNYYQPPPMTQAISYYQTSPYSPSRS
ncbi:hypothetical protein G9A89_004365 [Geosiphon pyriformis]|nr:hypothetical protein G9A89_004365 [Geosiphon pyriformis]